MILRQLILLLLVSSILTGCSFFSPVKVYPASTYTISAFKEGVYQKRARSSKTLLVTAPMAAPGYASSKMIYVSVPFKLKSFADNRWVAPPSVLLEELIADRLRQAGYFHAVVTPPFSGVSDYQLDMQLQMLQQEFLSPISQVHLIMRVTLMNIRSSLVIGSRTFDIKEAAAGNDPYSGVLATNKAAQKLSTKIAQFVIATVSKKR